MVDVPNTHSTAVQLLSGSSPDSQEERANYVDSIKGALQKTVVNCFKMKRKTNLDEETTAIRRYERFNEASDWL